MENKVCPKCGGSGPFYKNASMRDGLSTWCAACNRADRARYSADNREKVLATKRATMAKWAAEHPEEKRARSKADREKNKARIREQQRAWAAKNRAKLRAKHKAWRDANPERLRETMAARVAAKPEAYRRIAVNRSARRRARIRSVTCTLTAAQWRDTLEYFGHACAYCLRTGIKLTQDHVVPVAAGGDHAQHNVVPACAGCNKHKGARPVWTMVL